MLTNLIENRGKEFSNLLKIGDYLARSLRENVELFYVEKNKVTYLTESGGVITGNFSLKPTLKLTNIKVDDSSILENREAFEAMTNKKVSSLLSNLLESDYQEAEDTFDQILSVFETKLSYDRIKERLVDKTQRFGEQTSITSSPQFQKVSELKDKLIDFLKENKDSISKIPEVRNGIKLASVISNSFNLPRVTLESLAESKVYEINVKNNSSIYEHLCRQELIAKELLEAKDNFETTWANNELISDLASMVFEKNRSLVENKVAEIITKIPYFALSTKKQLSTIIENCLSLSDVKVSSKDINSFVSTIFEMKKPVKQYVLGVLNEKYGINVSNLTEIPTFSNLIKTESLLFSVLGKIAPTNSVIKQTLTNFAKSLTEKNGAESIDLVDFLNEIFSKAGYKNTINETSLLQYLDFAQVADDLGKIGSILKMLKPMMQGASPEMGTGMNAALQSSPAAPEEGVEDGGMEDMGDLEGEEGMEEDPMSDAESAAEEIQDEEGDVLPGEEGMGGEEFPPEENGLEVEEEEEEPGEVVDQDKFMGIMSQLEDLLGSLESKIEGGEEEGGEIPEEGMEDEEDMGDEEDDDIHIDIDSHNEEDEEEGEEEGEHEDEEEDKALFQKMFNKKMKGK